jgi:predicted nuclease of predicted toxin-antitoxin system
MAIRFVLDQGLPRTRDAASQLRDLGYECTHAGEIGMWKAADDEILAIALERHATIVTLDADFHAILAVSGASQWTLGNSLAIEGLGAPEIVELVQHVLAAFEADLTRGSLVTVKARKTTCHKLPIGDNDRLTV